MLSQGLDAVRRERMSTVDTAWLRMDSPANLMMIVSVLMFDQPLDRERFRQTLIARFLPYRRFRSRVQNDLSGVWWVEQEVDLDQHLIYRDLPIEAGDNKSVLEALVGELSATPLDPALPLWQMHLVDGCVGADGKIRQAAIIRIHHCIADGIALVGVLLSMFDPAPLEIQRVVNPGADEPEEENPWLQILQPVTRATVKAIDSSTAMLTRYLGFLTDSEKIAERVVGVGQIAGQVVIDAVKLVAMTSDSSTRLKGKPAGKKHVCWSAPLPLDEIKVIGKALGASVNDVLMTSVAGAVGGYLRAKGDVVSAECQMRAMVPVNLRKASRVQKLGNAFGLVPLVLPIGIDDPLARLQEVRRRMNELKDGYQALVAMAVLGVLGAAPKQMQNQVQNYFAKKATVVMSNVPGPQTPLYLAGSQLEQIMFWVPQSGDIGVGVSILSYNGGVQFGIVTDDAIANDPQEIIARFQPEFEKLVLLALMSEWA